MSMIRATFAPKYTHFDLGFKVSKELLEDDLYGTMMRTGIGDFHLGVPEKAPIADWPPKPDNLNVRWWT